MSPNTFKMKSIYLIFAVIALLCITLTQGQRSGSTASKFSSCEDCVDAGYGWSHEQQKCGGFVNTDCNTDDSDLYELDNSAHAQYNDIDELDDNDYDIDDGPKTFSWADTDATTYIWNVISKNDLNTLNGLLERDPDVVYYRSGDGRSALHWAYEYNRPDMVAILLANGADEDAEDRDGNKPADMANKADL